MKSGRSTVPLSSRDEQILDYVHRFRLSTREFLHREFFAALGPTAVAKVVARLTGADYLREHLLSADFRYFVLGRRAARERGLDGRLCRRFTEQSFPVAYGLAAYCLKNSFPKPTAAEIHAMFPELADAAAHDGLYFRDTHDGVDRLAMPLLDRGNNPRTIFKKLERLITQRQRHAEFFRMIRDGRFCITILTAWPEKQRYLSSAVRMQARGPVHVRVECVPELQRLFPRM